MELGGPQTELRGSQTELGRPQTELGGPQREPREPQRRLGGPYKKQTKESRTETGDKYLLKCIMSVTASLTFCSFYF